MAVEREVAVINDEITLRNNFRYGQTNDLFNPYAISKVDILDSDGSTVIETFTGSQITHDSTGKYHVVATAITTAKTIYDRWTFTPSVGATAITKTNTCVVWTVIGEAGTDFTYDITTNLGKIRALIGDTDVTSIILTDAKISAFLVMKSNDLYATAALALLAIAASKSLLAKKKTAGDYSEDLTAIAKECRATAAVYQEMSENIPAEAQAESFFNDFSYNDVLIRKELREETE